MIIRGKLPVGGGEEVVDGCQERENEDRDIHRSLVLFAERHQLLFHPFNFLLHLSHLILQLLSVESTHCAAAAADKM